MKPIVRCACSLSNWQYYPAGRWIAQKNHAGIFEENAITTRKAENNLHGSVIILTRRTPDGFRFLEDCENIGSCLTLALERDINYYRYWKASFYSIKQRNGWAGIPFRSWLERSPEFFFYHLHFSQNQLLCNVHKEKHRWDESAANWDGFKCTVCGVLPGHNNFKNVLLIKICKVTGPNWPRPVSVRRVYSLKTRSCADVIIYTFEGRLALATHSTWVLAGLLQLHAKLSRFTMFVRWKL